MCLLSVLVVEDVSAGFYYSKRRDIVRLPEVEMNWSNIVHADSVVKRGCASRE